MATFWTGLASCLLVIAFLGILAVKLNAIPLWVVFALGAGMMATDFIVTMRRGGEE